MNSNQERFGYLLEQYAEDRATQSEKDELYVALRGTENDELLAAWLEDHLEQATPATDADYDKWDALLENKIFKNKPAVITPLRWLSWRRAVAAAAIITALAGGTYLFMDKKPTTDLVKNETQEQRFKNDIAAPLKPRATIKLADGSSIALDSATSGTLATQGNTKLSRTADGKILYEGRGEGSLVYNTLDNPRGSTVIDLTLADGSRVWLNAGSAITYPVAFTGTERKISITGEAYFEVAHNPAKPFKVSLPNEGEVTVLGTHFNVNAYTDESATKVTLLEGSVKLTASPSPEERAGVRLDEVRLKPGQQGVLATNGQLTTSNNIDLDQVMAWKNGFFSFNKADIKTVMREVARWYNVEVSYEGATPAIRFVGDMQRSLSLAQVLRALEKSKVHFRIEGKHLTVMP